MAKNYNLFCAKHGGLHIEVERPPIIQRNAYCPWCAQRLTQPDKDAKEKRQPNYAGEGVEA